MKTIRIVTNMETEVVFYILHKYFIHKYLHWVIYAHREFVWRGGKTRQGKTTAAQHFPGCVDRLVKMIKYLTNNKNKHDS